MVISIACNGPWSGPFFVLCTRAPPCLPALSIQGPSGCPSRSWPRPHSLGLPGLGSSIASTNCPLPIATDFFQPSCAPWWAHCSMDREFAVICLPVPCYVVGTTMSPLQPVQGLVRGRHLINSWVDEKMVGHIALTCSSHIRKLGVPFLKSSRPSLQTWWPAPAWESVSSVLGSRWGFPCLGGFINVLTLSSFLYLISVLFRFPSSVQNVPSPICLWGKKCL